MEEVTSKLNEPAQAYELQFSRFLFSQDKITGARNVARCNTATLIYSSLGVFTNNSWLRDSAIGFHFKLTPKKYTSKTNQENLGHRCLTYQWSNLIKGRAKMKINIGRMGSVSEIMPLTGEQSAAWGLQPCPGRTRSQIIIFSSWGLFPRSFVFGLAPWNGLRLELEMKPGEIQKNKFTKDNGSETGWRRQAQCALFPLFQLFHLHFPFFITRHSTKLQATFPLFNSPSPTPEISPRKSMYFPHRKKAHQNNKLDLTAVTQGQPC